MMEEVEEYEEAFYNEDPNEMADALADLIWFAIGTALFHGLDLRPVMDEVHKSNMSKSPNPKSWKNCDKGPNFKKPNIAKALHDGDLSDV